MSNYTLHAGEHMPRAERCCDRPEIEAIRGLGIEENYIVTVACVACGFDFMSIWPKGSLHDDGWPKDWTRPPVTPSAENVTHG